MKQDKLTLEEVVVNPNRNRIKIYPETMGKSITIKPSIEI